MTSPDTLGLLLQRFLGSYADGHRTMGGTGHTTRNQKFMQAGDAHQTEGARDAPPRGTCKQRRSLQIQRCHNPTGSDEAQGSQKKPLLSHSTQRGARTAPSEQERASQLGDRVPRTHPRGHEHGDTNTDAHRCTRFPTQRGLRVRRQVPLEGAEDGEHLLLPKECLQLHTSQTVRENF